MELWKELLSSDVGILSLITIGVTLVMICYCMRLFVRKAIEAERSQQQGR